MATPDPILVDAIRETRRQARRKVARARRVKEDAGSEVIRFVRRNAARGVGQGGRRFAPYAPSTAERKGRRRPVTLRETGQMLGSLKTRRQPPKQGGLLTGVDVRFGGAGGGSRRNERIARFHLEGTRKMPARPLGLTRSQKSRLQRKFGVRLGKFFTPADRRRSTTLRIDLA